MSAASATSAAASADAQQRPVSGFRQLRGLLPYVRRYKGGVALGMVMLAAMALVGNFVPLILGVMTDLLRGKMEPLANLAGPTRASLHFLFSFYAANSRQVLGIYCLLLVGVIALKGVFSFWTRYILIGLSRDIEYDLRNDLLKKLVELEPAFYARNRTGELMSRCTNDLNAVRMVLGPGIMYSGTTLASMLLAAFFMVSLSPALSLWVLLPVPVVALTTRYFGNLIHRLFESIQAGLATLSARAQENLAGVRVVRAYAQEQAELRGFDEPNREYVARNIKWIRAWSMFFPSLQALIGSTFLIVLLEGGRLVILGRISIGVLTAFFVFMTQLIWPMIALGWVTNIFQRGAASMGRLNYVLAAEPEINDREVPPQVRLPAELPGDGQGRSRMAVSGQHETAPEIHGEIEFRHMTFAYPGGAVRGRAVLQDITLHVPAGSTLAIVGPTGSGKSTLAALIARLWEAPPGSLLLDGRSIREWPLAELRGAIGFVPQETFLFSDTIGENVAFGVSAAEPLSIIEAADLAGIHGDIAGFPKAFDTIVGERGITLSGGQKQRTALARAILRQPKILILDDALSSVDTETEERILRGLRREMRERTTVLVSHRCSTVKEADQIIVLREGRIVERGTHEELLAREGYYADLYQKQLLEEELERV